MSNIDANRRAGGGSTVESCPYCNELSRFHATAPIWPRFDEQIAARSPASFGCPAAKSAAGT